MDLGRLSLSENAGCHRTHQTPNSRAPTVASGLNRNASKAVLPAQPLAHATGQDVREDAFCPRWFPATTAAAATAARRQRRTVSWSNAGHRVDEQVLHWIWRRQVVHPSACRGEQQPRDVSLNKPVTSHMNYTIMRQRESPQVQTHHTANCMIIAQFPIEQGQFAELPLKKIEKVQNLGDCYAIRSMCVVCHISHADSLQISQHAPRGRLPAGRSVMSPAAWSCSPARIRACPCPAGTPPTHALKTTANHTTAPERDRST
jgi:hypothetical protein